MIDLHTFLTSVQKKRHLTNKRLLLFHGTVYSGSFFSYLIHYLRQQQLWPLVEMLDLNDIGLDKLFAKIETSFLGMSGLYWVKNVDQLKSKDRTFLLKYLSEYAGNNTIALWIGKNSISGLKDKFALVQIPDWCDQRLFTLWSQFFCTESRLCKKFVEVIFKKQRRLSLDEACLLLHYLDILGSVAIEFVDQQLDDLLSTQRSFFALSEHFFCKNATSFYQERLRIGQKYPDLFWLSFWTEQIWRAYYSVLFMKRKQFALAKKAAYRLPFSFLQNRWQTYSLTELRNVYQYLYSLDFKLKNGAAKGELDLFYTRFFLKRFLKIGL